MKVNGIDIDLKVDGAALDINPGELTLILSDSIHKPLPTAEMVVLDPSGMLKEIGFPGKIMTLI